MVASGVRSSWATSPSGDDGGRQERGDADAEGDAARVQECVLQMPGQLGGHRTDGAAQVTPEQRRADGEGHDDEGDQPGEHDEQLSAHQPCPQAEAPGHQPVPIR